MNRAVAIVLSGVALAVVASTSCAGKGDCRYNSDCFGAYCSNGECKKDCVDATIDCPKGFVCNAVAQCERADLASGGAPDGSSGTDGSSNDGSTTDGSTTDGGTSKVLLDLCSSDAECTTKLCRPYAKGEKERCTKTCTSHLECPANERCEQFGSESYCVMGDVGRSCNSAATCHFACLTTQGYCTSTCQTGADCPNGYGCQPVGSPAIRVCAKAAVPCGPGDTAGCIAPAACDTSPSNVVASCTLACDTAADCPQRAAGLPAWTCNGLCRRPGDVYGPLANGEVASYACNASSTVVNVCNDGQHIDFAKFTIPAPPAVSCSATMTTDGVAGDVCVDSCRYRGGCAYGYACTAVGSVGGGRIGLCLPGRGGNEVGAGCTEDASCFFGYCNRTKGKCSRDCTADSLCPSGSTCVAGGGPTVEGAPFRRCE